MISVTQVLGVFSRPAYSGVDQSVIAEAADRGRRVHAWCAGYARKVFMLPPAQDICGYTESFVRWFDSVVERVVLVEEELVHPTWMYVGHPDLVVALAGSDQHVLIDLKTPLGILPQYKAQLAAYKELIEAARGIAIDRMGILRLKRDGGPALFTESTESARDLAAFLHALEAYKYFYGGDA